MPYNDDDTDGHLKLTDRGSMTRIHITEPVRHVNRSRPTQMNYNHLCKFLSV